LKFSEKVEQAIPQSSPKFKSVALLLHTAKVGVTLSVVDQAVGIADFAFGHCGLIN